MKESVFIVNLWIFDGAKSAGREIVKVCKTREEAEELLKRVEATYADDDNYEADIGEWVVGETENDHIMEDVQMHEEFGSRLHR